MKEKTQNSAYEVKKKIGYAGQKENMRREKPKCSVFSTKRV
jgi:hypothetical protein